MIYITNEISIDEKEIHFNYIRSSGPGGQNINKVSTAVQLRYNIKKSTVLSDEVKLRMVARGGKRISEDGELIIEAKRYRSQSKNREDALKRFVELVQLASRKPKDRKKTKPSKAASESRISEKKKQGALKKNRADRPNEWD